MRLSFGILDCGYVLALVWKRGTRRGLVFRLRFPFPLTLRSWRYVLRSRT